jgi:hypothetical protein
MEIQNTYNFCVKFKYTLYILTTAFEVETLWEEKLNI